MSFACVGELGVGGEDKPGEELMRPLLSRTLGVSTVPDITVCLQQDSRCNRSAQMCEDAAGSLCRPDHGVSNSPLGETGSSGHKDWTD